MTFQQYIENPLGKRNAVFSQRDMYKQLYTQKFDAVFMRETGQINFTLYWDKGKDQFYAHVKIPSEVVPHFYYDVVIKFSTKDNGLRVGNTLNEYDVQFFSNDPAFVFTYERVFHKLGMFVEECKPKASKIALRKDPKEKNPYEVPGYVKSIYFCYLFMKRSNLFSKAQYKTIGQPFNVRKMLSEIENTDKKIADRQIKGEEVAKQQAKEKRAGRNREISDAKAKQGILNGQRRAQDVDTSKRVKVTGTTKTVKPVGRIASVKRSKAVKK